MTFLFHTAQKSIFLDAPISLTVDAIVVGTSANSN